MSNTPSSLWEMYAYVVLAQEFEYSVEFREVPPVDAAGRPLEADELQKRTQGSGHNIPVDVIARMMKRWQPLSASGGGNAAKQVLKTEGKPPTSIRRSDRR